MYSASLVSPELPLFYGGMKKPIYEKNYIAELRKRANMTQEELAASTGISFDLIRSMESRRRPITHPGCTKGW